MQYKLQLNNYLWSKKQANFYSKKSSFNFAFSQLISKCILFPSSVCIVERACSLASPITPTLIPGCSLMITINKLIIINIVVIIIEQPQLVVRIVVMVTVQIVVGSVLLTGCSGVAGHVAVVQCQHLVLCTVSKGTVW